jgi:hypothetical protein
MVGKDTKGDGHKQHFELSPANKNRLNAYLVWYNSEPSRVTTKWKIGDVVNAALDRWLSARMNPASERENGHDAPKNWKD